MAARVRSQTLVDVEALLERVPGVAEFAVTREAPGRVRADGVRAASARRSVHGVAFIDV